MADPVFDIWIAWLLDWEGGVSDHAADPGGVTVRGITLRLVRALRLDFDGDGRPTRADLRAMGEADTVAVYRRHFWEAVAGDDLPGPVAFVVADAAVNQGPARAARFLQRAVGAAPDGVVGPRTLAATRWAWAEDPRRVIRDIAARRAVHYSGLAHFATFGLGWSRRLIDCAITAAGLIGSARGRNARDASHA